MIKIRKGTPRDISAALSLIQELAIYEKAEKEVAVTEASMLEDGFGDQSLFEFFVAEQAGEILGIAVYFYTYSTWKGRVLYLEDLVVRESMRRQGIGKLLFDALVRQAKEVGAVRLCWQVLDWNEPAIKFYEKINAHLDGEWINCKFTKEDLKQYKFND